MRTSIDILNISKESLRNKLDRLREVQEGFEAELKKVLAEYHEVREELDEIENAIAILEESQVE